MSELVRRCCTFFHEWRQKCLFFGLFMASWPAYGQEGRKVSISFVPPPLENATYSLGIYEAKSGKLVRRLLEIAPESAFTAGLNGLITSWDGKDDEGKAVPPGRYAARGYAVGAMKVEGVGAVGNDWLLDGDNLRIRQVATIALVPEDDGLAVIASVRELEWEMLRHSGVDGHLIWHSRMGTGFAGGNEMLLSQWTLDVKEKGIFASVLEHQTEFDLASGKILDLNSRSANQAAPKASAGTDNTLWKIDDGNVLQSSATGEVLRRLVPKAGEPIPVQVVASAKSERIYLLENSFDWQRVRGLSWVETKEEDGKTVSTWKTFFERNIRKSAVAVTEDAPAIEITLVDNPLVPGKPQKAKLRADTGGDLDDKGSYLATSDRLRLRRISKNPEAGVASLQKGKVVGQLRLYQTDGAVREEFSIEGAKNMMAFDAGEIEMTADGEKTHPAKAAEPPDL